MEQLRAQAHAYILNTYNTKQTQDYQKFFPFAKAFVDNADQKDIDPLILIKAIQHFITLRRQYNQLEKSGGFTNKTTKVFKETFKEYYS